MNENKMGPFIAELRKEKNMTQLDLATQLHITDKAVSKWERGCSCPDIFLLSPLAEILGVTTGELLNGCKNEYTSKEVEATVNHAFTYAAHAKKKKRGSFHNILTLSFSLLLLIGIFVCSICDMAISGAFTWSLYPISSMLFAWFLFVPVLKYGTKGISGSLIALSLLIIPFLYVLSNILGGSNLILPIGIPISALSIVYLWCVYFLFQKMKVRKFLATACSLLLTVPLCFLINCSLSKLISEPLLDIWDLLTMGLLLTGSIIFFVLNYKKGNG